MNKKKIIIIIIASIIVLIAILSLSNSKNYLKRNMEKFVEKQGYESDGGSSYYYKQISDINLKEYYSKVESKQVATFETNYFNTINYQFSKNKREYNGELETTLNEIYNIKTDTIDYNYRLVIDNSSFIFSGSYKYDIDKVEFTCTNEYDFNFDVDDDDEDICTQLENESKEFYIEVLDMITRNMRIVNKIKKLK